MLPPPSLDTATTHSICVCGYRGGIIHLCEALQPRLIKHSFPSIHLNKDIIYGNACLAVYDSKTDVMSRVPQTIDLQLILTNMG